MSGSVISTVSAIVDLPLAMPHLPERGGDVLGTASEPAPGGGVNTALAAARQGVPTTLASPLGSGQWGELARTALMAAGVACPIQAPLPGDTGLCVTIVEPDGERTFLSAPGVEAHVRPEWLAPIAVAAGDVVVASGYDLAYESGPVLMAWLESVPGRLVLDVSPVCDLIAPALLDRALARAAIVSLNERETGLLGGTPGVRERLRRVESRASALHRVGARGAFVEITNDDDAPPTTTLVASLPLRAEEVVDTTGAGDAHTGVLAAELARGADLLAAVRRANIAGAIAVTRRGPATSPTRAELDRRDTRM